MKKFLTILGLAAVLAFAGTGIASNEALADGGGHHHHKHHKHHNNWGSWGWGWDFGGPGAGLDLSRFLIQPTVEYVHREDYLGFIPPPLLYYTPYVPARMPVPMVPAVPVR